MKTIAIALTFLAAAWSQCAPAVEAKPASPVIGVWAVDTSRLPMAPDARPRSVTITFSDAGDERLRMRVEVMDAAGTLRVADGVTPLDGSPTPVEVNFEADVAATTQPRSDLLILQLGKGGVPASTRIYAVQPDGESMVETVAHFTREGQPVLRENYFTRVR
ncbi:MAG: hypothetical protein H4O13_15655 [Xanthomonadales bacterium]|nr:hypothetical protein [Xanthomonadales bacterium]